MSHANWVQLYISVGGTVLSTLVLWIGKQVRAWGKKVLAALEGLPELQAQINDVEKIQLGQADTLINHDGRIKTLETGRATA